MRVVVRDRGGRESESEDDEDDGKAMPLTSRPGVEMSESDLSNSGAACLRRGMRLLDGPKPSRARARLSSRQKVSGTLHQSGPST